jgi:hypothetical protein
LGVVGVESAKARERVGESGGNRGDGCAVMEDVAVVSWVLRTTSSYVVISLTLWSRRSLERVVIPTSVAFVELFEPSKPLSDFSVFGRVNGNNTAALPFSVSPERKKALPRVVRWLECRSTRTGCREPKTKEAGKARDAMQYNPAAAPPPPPPPSRSRTRIPQ